MSPRTTEIETIVDEFIEKTLVDFFDDNFLTESEANYAFEYLTTKIQDMSFNEFFLGTKKSTEI